MTDADNFDTYVERAMERFDTFVSWSVSYWPCPDRPLNADDFGAARTELVHLLASRLASATAPGAAPASSDGASAGTSGIASADTSTVGTNDASAQYFPVTPAPWP